VSDPETTAASPWRRALQAGVSLLILGILLSQVDGDSWTLAWQQSKPLWLLGAVALKSLTLLLHELRLWMAFEEPRPPLLRVCAIGPAAGIINLIAPGRAGDFACIAMLHRECDVKVGAATTAVGLVAFLEAAMLGVFLLCIVGLGAINFEAVYQNMAAIQHVEIDASGQLDFLLRLIGFGLLGSIGLAGLALLWWVKSDRGQTATPKGRIQTILMDTIEATMGQLSSPASLIGNVVLAGLQVLGMVGAFAMALTAVGISVPYPWVAAASILLLSSVAAIGLPPALAAGPALASMAVLPLFGIGDIQELSSLASDPRILAYTGAYWIISQVPAALFGIPCLSGRMDLLNSRQREPSSDSAPAEH